MKNSSLPIGVFDSGFGGLTVVKEIIKQLPYESIIYFGDTARLPYGSKSKEVVRKFSFQILKFLTAKKIKMVVVACNTASSYVLEDLRKKTKLPVIGVIEPVAKKAILLTRNKKIGVIGTEGTIKSKAYENSIKKINKNIQVFSVACPLFVPLVEEGWTDGSSQEKITEKIAKEYLWQFKNKKIDILILGCTHYPLIKNIIKRVVDGRVKLIDSASSTVEETKNLLISLNILRDKNKKPKYEFYVSDAPEKFSLMGSKFLGRNISKVIKVDIEKYNV